VTRVVALLCVEGGEKESQVGSEAAEDARAAEADAMVLAISSNEALVVDVMQEEEGGGGVLKYKFFNHYVLR
jgi:hypothetical protein